MSLATYRGLFRAARVAFQGDERVLAEARNRIRQEYRSMPELSPTDPEFQKRIQHAQEVATFLRSNVVQGIPKGDNLYKLNIHEHTERGDNDSVNMPCSTGATSGLGSLSGRRRCS